MQVFGRVQGVFFRERTRQMAQALGLVGWVKNEPDGSVRIVAEGKKENLQELLDWCKKGKEPVAVERVEVKWRKGTKEFTEFLISN